MTVKLFPEKPVTVMISVSTTIENGLVNVVGKPVPGLSVIAVVVASIKFVSVRTPFTGFTVGGSLNGVTCTMIGWNVTPLPVNVSR